MIATKKYEGLGIFRKMPFGGKLIERLYRQIAGDIMKLHAKDVNSSVLTTGPIISFLPVKIPASNHDKLYSLYLGEIDKSELSFLINSFLKESKTADSQSRLSLMTSYLFAFFMDFWCPLVDHAHSIIKNDKNLSFLGSKYDLEFDVLKAVLMGDKKGKGSVKNFNILSTKVLGLISRSAARIKAYRELDSEKLLTHFSKNTMPSTLVHDGKVIVISILEERRFPRMAQLHRELKNLGYTVILYSSLPKGETVRGIKMFPELEACLVLDRSLISKDEARDVLNKAKQYFEKTYQLIGKSDTLGSHTYRGVPLFKIAWNNIHHVILLRGMQIGLNQYVIEKFLKKYNVCGFIGMDNSAATSAWMSECSKRNIPTFFHYYNAALSPIVYQLLLDSFKPTAWILGGSRQLECFKEIKGFDHNNYHVAGDMFADTVVRCDKKKIRKKIRERKGIPDDAKVIVLVSSYIVADFTEERKKELFTSVADTALALGMQLIVKAHPNEDIELLKKQMDLWNVHGFIFHTESIRDTFIAGDVVCMNFSEAAQQAMLVGIPVLSLIPEDMLESFDKHWDYFSSGAVEYIPLGASPTESLDKLVFNESYRSELIQRGYDYTKKLLGDSDGNNAYRFASYIDSIISQN